MRKEYVGTCKAKEGQHGNYLIFNGHVNELEKIRANANEKGYFTIFISKRKEVGKYGETHSAVIAPPREPQNVQHPVQPTQAPVQDTGRVEAPYLNQQVDDIPFGG
jgi:hypothetical protein